MIILCGCASENYQPGLHGVRDVPYADDWPYAYMGSHGTVPDNQTNPVFSNNLGQNGF